MFYDLPTFYECNERDENSWAARNSATPAQFSRSVLDDNILSSTEGNQFSKSAIRDAFKRSYSCQWVSLIPGCSKNKMNWRKNSPRKRLFLDRWRLIAGIWREMEQLSWNENQTPSERASGMSNKSWREEINIFLFQNVLILNSPKVCLRSFLCSSSVIVCAFFWPWIYDFTLGKRLKVHLFMAGAVAIKRWLIKPLASTNLSSAAAQDMQNQLTRGKLVHYDSQL